MPRSAWPSPWRSIPKCSSWTSRPSGLDLLVRREFMGSMVGLAAEGRTIFLSSHQLGEVERVASHVAFIAKGRLLLSCLDGGAEAADRSPPTCVANPMPPDPTHLGKILQHDGSGNLAGHTSGFASRALEIAGSAEGIFDVEVTSLQLEEIYLPLLAGRAP